MSQQLLKNSAIYTVGGMLPKVVSFFLLPIITRYLTPADYGIVTAMTALMMFLQMVAGLQVNAGYARCYFDYQQEQDRKDLLGTAFFSGILINIVLLGICLCFAPILQRLYPEIPFNPFYVIAIVTVPLAVALDLIQMLYRMQERPVPFVAVSLLRFVFNLVFIVILVFWKQAGAKGLLLAGLLAVACVLPIIIAFTFRYIRFVMRLHMLRGLLFVGLQTIPYMISAAVMTNADRYLVNRLASIEDLGVYGVAWKLALILVLFNNALMMSYDPHFFRVASNSDLYEAKSYLGNLGAKVVMGFTWFGVGIAVFSYELVDVLLPPAYKAAGLILPWLAVAKIFSLWDGISSAGAKYCKKMLWFTPIYVIGCLLNIILDLWWIPKWGAAGAAYATMVCAFVIMVLRFSCSQKFYPVIWPFRKIAAVLIPAAVLVVFSFSRLGPDMNSLLLKTFGYIMFTVWCFYVLGGHMLWSRLKFKLFNI